MMFGYGGFGWIGMLIGLVIVFAAIIGLVWLAMSMIQRTNERDIERNSQDQAELSPRELAAIRYAKGEISHEEYQQILSDLGV
jgi:putative membrane protein